MKKLALILLMLCIIKPTFAAQMIDPAQAYAVALHGTPSDLKRLLRSGYDVNQPYQCNTLLSAAVKSGIEEPALPETTNDTLHKITLLLNAGADINYNPCPDKGMLPLSWAVSLPLILEKQKEEAIAEFEEQVANSADYCDYQAITPKPCRYLSEDEQYKIKASIDKDYTQKWARLKPLHMSIIKLLLKRGAIINKTDFNHQSPLLYAASLPSEAAFESVEYLLSKGAYPATKNSDNQTALFFAQVRKNPAVVNRLMEYGADPTVKDDQGFLFNQSRTATFRTIFTDDDSILLEILY